MNRTTGIMLALVLWSTQVSAQVEVAPPPRLQGQAPVVPIDVASYLQTPVRQSAAVLINYEADRGSLSRTYFVRSSPIRYQRFQQFYTDWLAALSSLKLTEYPEAVREDLVALQERIRGEQATLQTDAAKLAAVEPLLPFLKSIVALEDGRRNLLPFDPQTMAGHIDRLAKNVRDIRISVSMELNSDSTISKPYLGLNQLRYAQSQVQLVSLNAKTWFDFYNGYDPLFSWWMAEPYKQLNAELAEYQEVLGKQLAGKSPEDWSVKPLSPAELKPTANYPNLAALLNQPTGSMSAVLQRYTADRGGRRGPGGLQRRDRDPTDRAKAWLAGLAQLDFAKLNRQDQIDYLLFKNQLSKELLRQELREKQPELPKVPRDGTGIVGRPIGAEALALELRLEMVPYEASELIALAEEEYEWCLQEMKAASREMGFGDDWKAAMEKVKRTAVPPGGQTKMVRDLALEAIDYVNHHRLVTVSPLAAETWRMTMMSPQQQLYSPFFLGGETIIVAYPTNTMSHDAKLQSMRGNNPHFSRATVQHELIPGHHLQGFQDDRYATHRRMFRTPLWPEGMAVYWEMVLYDRGFPRGPEDRIGMLFWRMHRCARVIFSFGYHLGKLTPQQCIDFLVEKAGHERDNATAEVRRSFTGGYGPLYQAAYQIGAMQFRALRRELVDTGRMSERDYHDAIYQQGPIPVELIRAILTKQPLTADFQSNWRFAEPKTKRKVEQPSR